jgi:DUF971 family protein
VNVPERIELDSGARTLTLHWAGALTQRVSHAALRRACPCAACRRLRLTHGVMCSPDEVAVVEIQSMAYGVQLVFSDGHAQGIFPWPFLEALGAGAQSCGADPA